MPKMCRTCHFYHDEEEFSINRSRKDGLCTRCKSCDQDYYRQIVADPERLAAKKRVALAAAKAFQARHRDDPAYRAKVRASNRLQYARRRELGVKRIRVGPPGRQDPFRRRARVLLHAAIRSGKILRPYDCQECGWVGRIQAHHADYNLPYEVEWLCSICHGLRHRID